MLPVGRTEPGGNVATGEFETLAWDRSRHCHRALFWSLVVPAGALAPSAKRGADLGTPAQPDSVARTPPPRHSPRCARTCPSSPLEPTSHPQMPRIWRPRPHSTTRTAGRCSGSRRAGFRRAAMPSLPSSATPTIGDCAPAISPCRNCPPEPSPRGSGRSRDRADLGGAEVRPLRSRRALLRSLEHLQAIGLHAAPAPAQGRAHGHRRQQCPRRLPAFAAPPA